MSTCIESPSSAFTGSPVDRGWRDQVNRWVRENEEFVDQVTNRAPVSGGSVYDVHFARFGCDPQLSALIETNGWPGLPYFDPDVALTQLKGSAQQRLRWDDFNDRRRSHTFDEKRVECWESGKAPVFTAHPNQLSRESFRSELLPLVNSGWTVRLSAFSQFRPGRTLKISLEYLGLGISRELDLVWSEKLHQEGLDEGLDVAAVNFSYKIEDDPGVISNASAFMLSETSIAIGTVIEGRLVRHLEERVRGWSSITAVERKGKLYLSLNFDSKEEADAAFSPEDEWSPWE